MADTTEPTWIILARQVFEVLDDQSKTNVWEGKLQDVFHHVGVSGEYRSRIIKLLETSGSIAIRQRGNRYQLTVIELLESPEELTRRELLPPEHLTEAAHRGTLALENLAERVDRLEAWRESLQKGGFDVAEAFRNFELRITRLEREVTKNGKKS